MSAKSLWLTIGLSCLAGVVYAQPPVLSGDPLDPSTGSAYILLPGVGVVLPGPDGKFNTSDDRIDASIIGDVDLAIRAGSGAVTDAIPDPPAGIALAPVMAPGGGIGGAVPAVPFRVFLSDGVTPPAAGHLLAGDELDGRGTFVLAFADIDGDGFVGPTASDGNADNAVELQEVYSPVGRQVAIFQNGAAQGSIGVRVGAPSSVGGLGIVLVGGAATGNVPPVYTDGTWVATQLPFMPPPDPRDLVGRGNVPPPDPNILVDVRIESEFDSDEVFLPAPGHPILGTPYAIPTDGSSPTVGLARSESGAASCVGIALAVDPATYQPVVKKQLLPLVAAGGSRMVAEPATSIAPLPDGSMPTVYLYSSDRLGNPADPTTPLTATVDVGPDTGMTSPNGDGNLHSETIVFASAEVVAITLDAAAAAVPGANRITVVAGGAICATVEVSGNGTVGGNPLPMTDAVTSVIAGRKPVRGRVSLRAAFQPPGSIDPISDEVEVTITAGATVILSRVVPAGSFVQRRQVAFFKDGPSVASARIAALSLRERRGGGYELGLRVRRLDLSTFDLGTTSIVQTLRIGSQIFTTEISCQENPRGTLTRCRS